jgi:hypothetical protein
MTFIYVAIKPGKKVQDADEIEDVKDYGFFEF